MKVLALPLNADHHQDGQMCAFRRVFGSDAVELDYMHHGNPGQALIDMAPGFDWVWMQLQETDRIQGHYIAEARRRAPGAVFTHWMGDWRSRVSGYLAGPCQECHVTFVSNDGQRDLFMAAGAKDVRYLQIGLDWAEDVLGQPAWSPGFRVPDVVLCGNYYGDLFPGGAQRLAGISALQNAGVDVGVVGTGWPQGFRVAGTCTVKQQHHVWKRAKVGLNINNSNDTRLYYSDRQLVAMASGTPLVCWHVPGLEEEFKDGEHCLFFGSYPEMVDKVLWLLSDESARARIGAAGRDIVMREHSWEKRVRDALAIVEEIRNRKS